MSKEIIKKIAKESKDLHSHVSERNKFVKKIAKAKKLRKIGELSKTKHDNLKHKGVNKKEWKKNNDKKLHKHTKKVHNHMNELVNTFNNKKINIAIMLLIAFFLIRLLGGGITGYSVYNNINTTIGEYYSSDVNLSIDITNIDGFTINGFIEEGFNGKIVLKDKKGEYNLLDYTYPDLLIEENGSKIDFEITSKNLGEGVRGINIESENDSTSLCSVWKINEIEFCNGYSKCCSFLEKEKNYQIWNSEITLNKGRYLASDRNIVSVKVYDIDYSFNPENSFLKFEYSDEKRIVVDLFEKKEFSSCGEACILKNSKDYLLNVQVNSGKIFLENYSYSTKISQNSKPIFRNIPNITMSVNTSFKLDLSNYVYDEDKIELDYFESDKINVKFNGTIVEINAKEIGKTFTYFSAYDGKEIGISNIFMIEIIEKVEQSVDVVKPVVRINEPVKWVKKIPVTDKKVKLEHIPLNITIKADGKEVSDSEVDINVKGKSKQLDIYENEKKIEWLNKQIEKRNTQGRSTNSLEDKKFNLQRENLAKGIGSGVKKLISSGITGYAVLGNEIGNETELLLNNDYQEVEVEYYTEGPNSFEETTSKGKKITISSDIHYLDILAYANIPNTEAKNVRIYKTTNGVKEKALFDGYDSDNDGLVDYVEWIVPHLSTQTYEIILITKAELLDSNRTYITDIYDYVKEQDDNWTRVNTSQYIRVTFEQNLTNEKDITLYVRNNESLNTTVEVYYYNSSQKILTFPIITNSGYYKEYLTMLNGSHETFDLKIVNLENLSTYLEFDHIIDPEGVENLTGWNKTHDNQSGSDFLYDVAVDSKDNVYFVGHVATADRMRMKSYNSSGIGRPNWDIAHSVSGGAGQYIWNGIDISDTDKVYVVGQCDDCDNGGGGGTGTDWSITRYEFNSSRNTTWDIEEDVYNTLGYTSCPQESDIAYDVAAFPGGGAVVVGKGFNANSSNCNPGFTSADWWIRKYDESGSQDTSGSWSSAWYDGNGVDDEAYGVDIDSQNRTIVVGYSDAGTGQVFTVIQYSKTGVRNWVSTFGILSIAEDVVIDSNDDIIAVGKMDNAVSAQSLPDWYIVKLNSSGNELWNKNFTGNTNNAGMGEEDVANGVIVDSLNNIYVVGFVHNATGSNDRDWHMKKYNSSGYEEWNLSWDSGQGEDYLEKIAKDSEDFYYLGGRGVNVNGTSTGDDWWMKKVEGEKTTQDLRNPWYNNYSNQPTSYNAEANWSVNLSDDIGLSAYIFAHNDTGTLTNQTPVTITGTNYVANASETLNTYKNGNVCGQFWFNDTSGKINQTNLSCFTVSNSVPSWDLTQSEHSLLINDGIYNYPNITIALFDDNDFQQSDHNFTLRRYVNGTLNHTDTRNFTNYGGLKFNNTAIFYARNGYYSLNYNIFDGEASTTNYSVNITIDTIGVWFNWSEVMSANGSTLAEGYTINSSYDYLRDEEVPRMIVEDNDVNYSLLTEYLYAVYNFDNDSNLGENNSKIVDMIGLNKNEINSSEVSYDNITCDDMNNCPESVNGYYGKARNVSDAQALNLSPDMDLFYQFEGKPFGSISFLVNLEDYSGGNDKTFLFFSNCTYGCAGVENSGNASTQQFSVGIYNNAFYAYSQKGTGKEYQEIINYSATTHAGWLQIAIKFSETRAIVKLGTAVNEEQADVSFFADQVSEFPIRWIGKNGNESHSSSAFAIDNLKFYKADILADETDYFYPDYSAYNLIKESNQRWHIQNYITGVADGTHNVRLYGADNALNWNSTSQKTFFMDSTGPSTENLTIKPYKAGDDGTINISANVTDLNGVDTVIARFILPDNVTSAVNYTMTNLSSIYSVYPTYNFSQTGLHSVEIWANDSFGNVKISQRVYFLPYYEISNGLIDITLDGVFTDWISNADLITDSYANDNIGIGKPWIDVDVGEFGICGILENTTAYCWGSSPFTEKSPHGTGRDTSQYLTEPTPLNMTAATGSYNLFKNITVGYEAKCGITTNDNVYCWGNNDQGALGHSIDFGNDNGVWSPWQVNITGLGAMQAKDISTGDRTTCAVLTNNSLYCWGNNGAGATGCYLGNGTTGGYTWTPTQTNVVNNSFTKVTVGAFHGCAIHTNKTISCWGWNGDGRAGLNYTYGEPTCGWHNPASPRSINSTNTYIDVEASVSHTCAIQDDGSRTLDCWGSNASGQIPPSNTPNKPSYAYAVTSLLTDVEKMALGNEYTCVTHTNKSMYCWGEGSEGQLGYGGISDLDKPTEVNTTVHNWTDISAYNDFTCGVKLGGQGINEFGGLWCWGDSESYLGLDEDYGYSTNYVPRPVKHNNTLGTEAGGDLHQISATNNDDYLYFYYRTNDGSLASNNIRYRIYLAGNETGRPSVSPEMKQTALNYSYYLERSDVDEWKLYNSSGNNLATYTAYSDNDEEEFRVPFSDINMTVGSAVNLTMESYSYAHGKQIDSLPENGTFISYLTVSSIPPLEGHRFEITNLSGDIIAAFDDEGNVYLAGSQHWGATLINATENSFVIENKTGKVAAYINSTGDLIITQKPRRISVQPQCTTNRFEIRNSTNDVVLYIDDAGCMGYTGTVYTLYDFS